MPMLSRQDAVAEMVDEAIGAWLRGKHAAAITLAGAAEGGMPKIEDHRPAFEVGVAAVMKFGKCSRTEAITAVNTGRDWSKHYSAERPEHINTDLTWAYVMRAYMHFVTVYPDAPQTENMKALRAKIEECLEPVRALGKALTEGALALGKMVSEMGLAASTILAQRVEPGDAHLDLAQDAPQDVLSRPKGQ